MNGTYAGRDLQVRFFSFATCPSRSIPIGFLVLVLSFVLFPGPVESQIRPIDLEGFVVTGTPVPRTEGSVASHVTILEGEELRLRGVTRVQDALSGIPGLVVVQGGSYGSTTSTFFRGAESDHLKVLIDGVAMNQAGGAFDFSGLSMADVERIEVVRGAASAFYGSDAMAGVIHIITRRGRGPLKASFSTSGGTYGRLNWGGDVHGGVGDSGYSLSVSRETTDGILDFNNQFENTMVSGKLYTRPDPKSRLEVAVRYSDRNFHFPTDGSGNVTDRNAFTFGEDWSLVAEASRVLSHRIEVLAVVKSHRWEGGSDDRADGPADTLGYFGYVSDDSFERLSGDFRVNLVPWTGSVVSMGLELEEEGQDSKSESFSQWGPSIGEDSYDRSNRGYYAHLVTGLSGWAGNLGIRLEDNEQYGEFLTYQMGISYSLPSSGTRFRGSLGRGLKEPTFFETASSGFSVGNPDLEPERSHVWEFGMEQSFAGESADVSVTWFRQTLEDLIQYTFTSPEPGGPNYFNIAEARTQGVEASLRWSGGSLSLSGGFTYLDSEVLDSGFDEGPGAVFVTGRNLIRRPKHSGSVATAYRFLRGTVSADFRWTGSRSDRDFSAWPAEAVELSSYGLLGLGADVSLLGAEGSRPAVDLTLRGENLLDTRYQEVFGFASPGRTFLVGLRMTFGGSGP